MVAIVCVVNQSNDDLTNSNPILTTSGIHRKVANRLKQKGLSSTETLTPGGVQKLLFVNEEFF